MPSFDAIIVGARPAGAATAMLLARADALQDAELLARAVDDATTGRRSMDAALLGYERVRDELSRDLFTASDAVARFDWTFDELAVQHRAMSDAMKAEVAHLAALDRTEAVPAA